MAPAFTGNNPGIEQAVNRMYTEETDVRQATGIDPALLAYVEAALAGQA